MTKKSVVIGRCTSHVTPPPRYRMTDRCKNITLPQTSFADSNKNGRSFLAPADLPDLKGLLVITRFATETIV